MLPCFFVAGKRGPANLPGMQSHIEHTSLGQNQGSPGNQQNIYLALVIAIGKAPSS